MCWIIIIPLFLQNQEMYQDSNYQKKLSVMYIEEAFHHQIQIRSVSNMYKLNVKLNKPIILTLYSLPVLKHIIEDNQCLKILLQMQTLTQIKVVINGYGIFNQRHEFEDIGKLFRTLHTSTLASFDLIKKIHLEFPGWRCLTIQTIRDMIQFVRKCKYLQEFKLNLNNCMNLLEMQGDSYQDTFYNKRTFGTQQFETLLEQICLIRSQIFYKLKLDFGGWEGIDNGILEIIIYYIGIMSTNLRCLTQLEINLNGWGIKSDNPKCQISKETLDKFFRVFEDFTSLEFLKLDLRNWSQNFRVNRYRERLQQISGGRKQQNPSTMYMFSATGTYFGSQLKNKVKNLKVEIIQ